MFVNIGPRRAENFGQVEEEVLTHDPDVDRVGGVLAFKVVGRARVVSGMVSPNPLAATL